MAPFSWPNLLTQLVRGEELDAAQARWGMAQILSGSATPVQIAGFAVALRAKGETVNELSMLAEVMMDFAAPITLTGQRVDVVGSGGDRANTVNISTMAAITAAAAGARVAKHGNRAASSKCGTADVLEALGVVLDLAAVHQQEVLDEVGIVFLFAPHYHSSLRHAAGPRRELGIATSFNFLGPLANPARPQAGAIGVADRRMAELMAGVLAARGSRGLVFHGGDGLDELTTTTSSLIWLIADGQVTVTELEPVELGIARAKLSDLVGGAPQVNAQITKAVLSGQQSGPVADIVALNAAAALLAWHGPRHDQPVAEQLTLHLASARQVLADGSAQRRLSRWAELTGELAS